MIESILYAIFAILGLGFLVFIHELGHYFMARRNGMRVDAFAIGFGKPLYTWEHKGVKWHINMLPFGGYVKIAGMQKEKGIEPSDIPDGFYGKSPWKRIQVALAGPVVNILFALVVFTGIWLFGGRNKSFAEFTHRIGWVDPKSALYEKGVRSGDIIQSYDGREFNGMKDLFVASLTNDGSLRIEGQKVDYATGEKRPFDYTLQTYDDLSPAGVKEKMSTIGVLSPAQYLIYGHKEGSHPGGIQLNDRLIWADGEPIFSMKQLSSLINESTAFLTVQRGDEVIQTKVPRVPLDELMLTPIEKAEVGDWQYEAGLKAKFQGLYFIPYNLSPTAEVEGRFPFIDEEDHAKAFEPCKRCGNFIPLQESDKILAVDGIPIKSPYEALELLQTRRVLAIVDRNPLSIKATSWKQADADFESYSKANLAEIVRSIGMKDTIDHAGNLFLLNQIVPQSLMDQPLTSLQEAQLTKEYEKSKKHFEKIQDPQLRKERLDALEKEKNRLVLGLHSLKDREVLYNPTPWQQFKSVFDDTWRTLSGLVSGSLNAKHVSGPVGIVHAVHQSWMIGVQEALFWLAVISLNLGIVNLLPIPVLDGGHIMFSFYELITRKKLSSKTMERMIVPFIALLIGFFIFVTFQDISRIFSKFF
jgi:regulator of sigma E protease